MIIVCGVDSFSTIAYYGFSRLNAIASEYCRPFDENRDGMLVAEGVGCLVLESEKHAKVRNHKIYAEICGYGMSSDAEIRCRQPVQSLGHVCYRLIGVHLLTECDLY